MLKDKPGDDHFLENACGDNNNFICIGPLTDGSSPLVAITTSTPSSTVLQEKKGWYLRLKSTEQVVTGAITLFGITTFSTHQPAVFTGSCTNSLGTSLVYNISYKDAAPAVGNERFQDLAGDGLPPSPVAGKVKIGDSEVPFCIGCSGDSPLEGSQASQLSSVSRAKSRLYWYLEKN
jgi:type IV pilus assembly protein PilY1